MKETIEELEAKLASARQLKLDKDRREKKLLCDYCIGKCFKRVYKDGGTVFITYENILEKSQYSDTLISEQVSVSFSITGYIIRSGNLKYLGAYKTARLP